MFDLILISIGLSLDTFALCVAIGAVSKRRFVMALKCGVIFGLFHIINIGIGWLIGFQIKRLVGDIDHWIAFFLLLYVGINLIVDSLKNHEKLGRNYGSFKTLCMCGVATSIDALIVGVTFSFFKMSPVLSMGTVGFIVALFSFTGVLIGHTIGTLWGKKAGIAGGLILIGLGTKILIEHLFF